MVSDFVKTAGMFGVGLIFAGYSYGSTPYQIKAMFENPSTDGDMEILSTLPDGSLLAHTPYLNDAPTGTIFKIGKDGQTLASFDIGKVLIRGVSRDPLTGHMYFSSDSTSPPGPRKFYEFDADLHFLKAMEMPVGYESYAGPMSYSVLSNGSDVRIFEKGGISTLFVLDAQKNLMLKKQLAASSAMQRTGDDRFLLLSEQNGHSQLTTYDQQGHVVLDRVLPEHDCSFIYQERLYPEESSLSCFGGSIVQLDRLGQILSRYEIDPNLRYCYISPELNLAACTALTSSQQVDIWSTTDWTFKRRLSASTLESIVFLANGVALTYSDRDPEFLDLNFQVQSTMTRPLHGKLYWFGWRTTRDSIPSWRFDVNSWYFQINSLIDGSVELDLEQYQKAAGLTVANILKVSDNMIAVAFRCTAGAQGSGLCKKGRVLFLER